MSKLKLRIWAAMVGMVVGWKNGSLFAAHTFKAMAVMMEQVLKAADLKRPRMFKLGIVVANDKHDICSIWVGPTVDADPYDRIEGLLKENAALREELARYISSQPQ